MQGKDALTSSANANPGAHQGQEEKNLDQKLHNRSYNPVDEADRGTVSDKLNTDAARYRKGPGPF